MLHKARHELKLCLALRAPELLIIMRRRVQVRIERRERLAFLGAEEALVRGAGKRRLRRDVRTQRRWRTHILDALDRDVGDDVHALHRGGDVVAREAVTPRLDVHRDARRALEHRLTKWTLELAIVVREGVPMLI